MKHRLDTLLVERGLAESRARAQALIMAGDVLVGGQTADKPGMQVREDAPIEIKAPLPYVSRGGLKLGHAVEAFGLRERIMDKVALDIGASTVHRCRSALLGCRIWLPVLARQSVARPVAPSGRDACTSDRTLALRTGPSHLRTFAAHGHDYDILPPRRSCRPGRPLKQHPKPAAQQPRRKSAGR